MAKAQAKDNAEEKDSFVDELKPGTKLMHGQYTIDSFLNAGGFGITYLAKDSLDRKIVIKECFPGAFCRRSRYVVQARSRAHQNELKSIVRLFVQEARSLAKLDHPNIVGVHQVFEDNDTAYMALDFVEGRDLLDTIEDPNHGLQPAQIKTILKEVLGAVGFIHDQGILHRDISPDNILINKEFHPVLIDFGAAREEATKQSRVLSALRVVKDGYSPQEFYIAGSDQSPSSDLYALSASFYHLINEDVPPNSQARLAAIASGEPDPYQPLAGRFPEYEDSFLAAIDKALAVLPKDRVQSAKEWIAMIDGTEGNVTALNVAAAAPSDADTPAAAATASASKSKMPMLLGSAAVIALLVGVGAFTLSGGDNAPATPAPAAPEVAVAEPVVEAPAPAPAPAEELPSFLTAEPETPVAEEPVVEAPAAVVEAPVVEEAPLVEDTQAVTPEPVIVAEPVAEPSVPEQPAVVEAPVVVEPPAVLRPLVRPESVEIAALPEPEPVPLPEPVVTPRPAVADPVDGAAFPDQSGNRPAADADTANVALPTTPDNVEAVGAGPEVEIAAVTPGNELVPEIVVAEDALAANWSVQLPFTPLDEGSNIIGSAAAVSPIWVQPGLVITSVNQQPVGSIAEIPSVLQSITASEDVAGTIPVVFGTLDLATGERADRIWVLPVVRQLSLTNGVAFETVFAGGEWRTSVADLPDSLTGGLEIGDVVKTYIPTAEAITGETSLQSIFDRELNNGTDQFMFAVERDGSMWVASLSYSGAAE